MTTIETTHECAAPAVAGARAPEAPNNDTLRCIDCNGACGTVIDAGFDPRLHCTPIRHAACAAGGRPA